MPSTDRKLELKAKTSVDQTGSQAAVYAKGLNVCVSGYSSLLANVIHNNESSTTHAHNK
jgi:hypothetical protein